MNTKYTHPELGKEIEAGMSGYYGPQREVRLKRDGREVLYVIGHAVIESSCCGGGSWIYAAVPGYVINWKNSMSETGRPVSEVEPILDEEARESIRQIIKTDEAATQIEFW
jgi:hypothetical protein